MTDPQLTAPESALVQWLADTVGLSRDTEAELARRLAGMRAALVVPAAVLADAKACIASPHEATHNMANWIVRMLPSAPQAVAPSEGETQPSPSIIRVDRASFSVAKGVKFTAADALKMLGKNLNDYDVWERDAKVGVQKLGDLRVEQWSELSPFRSYFTAPRIISAGIESAAPSSGNDKLRRLREFTMSRTVEANEGQTYRLGAAAMVNEIALEIDRLLAEPEPAAADELLEAAEAMVKRLDLVHAHPDYMGVWTVAHLHCGQYAGPQYHLEMEALRAAIAKARGAAR